MDLRAGADRSAIECPPRIDLDLVTVTQTPPKPRSICPLPAKTQTTSQPATGVIASHTNTAPALRHDICDFNWCSSAMRREHGHRPNPGSIFVHSRPYCGNIAWSTKATLRRTSGIRRVVTGTCRLPGFRRLPVVTLRTSADCWCCRSRWCFAGCEVACEVGEGAYSCVFVGGAPDKPEREWG